VPIIACFLAFGEQTPVADAFVGNLDIFCTKQAGNKYRDYFGGKLAERLEIIALTKRTRISGYAFSEIDWIK
jgi:hypothetical protein